MSKPVTRKVIVAHIPVLHRGYLQLFKAHPHHRELFVVGKDILKKFDYTRKDLRALEPSEAASIIKATNWFDEVKILTTKTMAKLNFADFEVVMPDDDISEYIQSKIPKAKTTLYPVFLRWDRRSIENIDVPEMDIVVSKAKRDKVFMGQAVKISSRSSDIWRWVGAVLQTKDGKTLFAKSNQGEPTPYSPWIEGDPRNIFNRGVAIEMSVFAHAEAAIVAEAAKRGLSLKGAKLYVTTFPCPACAKVIAHSGISACYYEEGYAVLDGRRVMEDYGIKVFRVESGSKDKTHPDTWVAYKKTSP